MCLVGSIVSSIRLVTGIPTGFNTVTTHSSRLNRLISTLKPSTWVIQLVQLSCYTLYTDPAAAKKIGSKVAGVNGSDWDTANTDIIKDLVTKKFTDNENLKAELLATGNKTMVESWRDPHYACGLYLLCTKTYLTRKNGLVKTV